MRKLPFVFAGIHATLTVAVFTVAILSPVRSGLLPIIMFALDMPISFLMIQISEMFYDHWGVRGTLFVDGLTFLVVGTLWFYLIGLLLSKILMWITERQARRTEHHRSATP